LKSDPSDADANERIGEGVGFGPQYVPLPRPVESLEQRLRVFTHGGHGVDGIDIDGGSFFRGACALLQQGQTRISRQVLLGRLEEAYSFNVELQSDHECHKDQKQEIENGLCDHVDDVALMRDAFFLNHIRDEDKGLRVLGGVRP
jgi:hypothetical protein